MPTAQPETTFVAEPGTHEMTSTAVQAAPREAVYRAYTDPELLVRFWGPPELPTEVDEFDPKPGGRWRMIYRDAVEAWRDGRCRCKRRSERSISTTLSCRSRCRSSGQ